MIEPSCWKRKCKHFIGVWQPDDTEMTERFVCYAFPERIPTEIIKGENDHLKSFKSQDNDITYEKAKDNEWPPPFPSDFPSNWPPKR